MLLHFSFRASPAIVAQNKPAAFAGFLFLGQRLQVNAEHIGPKLIAALRSQSRDLVTVVEIYDPEQVDIVSRNAPITAQGLFSTRCTTWNGYEYAAKLTDIPKVTRFIGREVNSLSLNFSNATDDPGEDGQFVNWLLSRKDRTGQTVSVEGMRVTLRLIIPGVEDEWAILGWYRLEKPDSLDDEQIQLQGKADFGNLSVGLPFRSLSQYCPLELGEPGCLGSETLAQKSILYQRDYYNGLPCQKTWAACNAYGGRQKDFFQGQQYTIRSGQATYERTVSTSMLVKIFTFGLRRKKKERVNVPWSSHQIEDDSRKVPVVLGRTQVLGVPLQWADTGTQVESTQMFSEGPIAGYTYTRSRTKGLNITSQTEHLGEYGNTGSQQVDGRFPSSSAHSGIAYQGITTAGSAVDREDDAPDITSVIQGMVVPRPDADGNFTDRDWSDEPIYLTRFVLTDQRFGDYDPRFVDDPDLLREQAHCDELLIDDTQTDRARLSSESAAVYGTDIQHFTSTGLVDSRYLAYQDGTSTDHPAFRDPYVEFFDPQTGQNAPVVQTQYLRRRYTTNVKIDDETTLADVLYDVLLPSFRGYLTWNWNGKMQVKSERKADNCFLRADVAAGASLIPVSNIRPWLGDQSGWLLAGVHSANAEPRRVINYRWSSAGNGIPISVAATGGVGAITSSPMLTGGSEVSPAEAQVTLSGSPNTGDAVTVTIDGQAITYVAADGETLNTLTRLIAGYINGHLTLREYIRAFVIAPGIIKIRCYYGALEVEEPLSNTHRKGDECMRVAMIFEVCGQHRQDSVGVNNILPKSFKINPARQNSYSEAKFRFVDASDDFRPSVILRKARKKQKQAGKKQPYEVDLTGVDNYHQAARLAFGLMSKIIDHDLHFTWRSSGEAMLLDEGDVVAVRHRVAGRNLNWVPVRIEELSLNPKDITIDMTGRLYSSVQYNDKVVQSAPLDQLSSAVNPNSGTGYTPASVGSGGPGTGGYSTTTAGGNLWVGAYLDPLGSLNPWAPDGVDRG